MFGVLEGKLHYRPWEIGRLTVPQLRRLLNPADTVDQGVLRAVSGLAIPQSPKREGEAVPLHEMARRAEKGRVELFDKVCEVKRLLPYQLAALDIATAAQYFVEVSGLPIEKFPPHKLRRRIAEYVMART